MPKVTLTENDMENLPEPDADGLFTVESRVKIDGNSIEVVEVMGKQYGESKKDEGELFNGASSKDLIGL